jgi:NADPH:quinone reductase-like Zn-dependent oxidoreductase
MNTSKQLFTHISSDGELTLSLVEVDVPKPKANEIVVKMEASPINPCDMWPMFGPANLSKASLNDGKSILTAPLYPGMLSRIKPRLDQTLPIGNEM